MLGHGFAQADSAGLVAILAANSAANLVASLAASCHILKIQYRSASPKTGHTSLASPASRYAHQTDLA